MDLIKEVENHRQHLKEKRDFEVNPIDLSLPVIPPFRGKKQIKLILLGQDPTVKVAASRQKISCTLNLDKNNSLRKYVDRICNILGITLENIYATNLYKYFYSIPPARTPEVLLNHLPENLDLLKKELLIYGKIPVLTLGEPVLQLLTHPNNKVKRYWDYDIRKKISNGNFLCLEAKDNLLNLDVFPLPHQPSLHYNLYNTNLENYLQIVKKAIKNKDLTAN